MDVVLHARAFARRVHSRGRLRHAARTLRRAARDGRVQLARLPPDRALSLFAIDRRFLASTTSPLQVDCHLTPHATLAFRADIDTVVPAGRSMKVWGGHVDGVAYLRPPDQRVCSRTISMDTSVQADGCWPTRGPLGGVIDVVLVDHGNQDIHQLRVLAEPYNVGNERQKPVRDEISTGDDGEARQSKCTEPVGGLHGMRAGYCRRPSASTGHIRCGSVRRAPPSSDHRDHERSTHARDTIY